MKISSDFCIISLSFFDYLEWGFRLINSKFKQNPFLNTIKVLICQLTPVNSFFLGSVARSLSKSHLQAHISSCISVTLHLYLKMFLPLLNPSFRSLSQSYFSIENLSTLTLLLERVADLSDSRVLSLLGAIEDVVDFLTPWLWRSTRAPRALITQVASPITLSIIESPEEPFSFQHLEHPGYSYISALQTIQ